MSKYIIKDREISFDESDKEDVDEEISCDEDSDEENYDE